METSLVESNSKLRGNFIDYNSFLELSSETRSTPVKSYDPIIDFEIFRELKERLRHELKSRKDKTELMGLSASQIGLPVNAVYIERNDNSSVLLIDPKLKPNTKNAYPELFIKLIKCPNSPTPYHLGLFIKSAIITSTTSEPYILEEDPNDPTFKFSANLQRIIWASNGFLPGDDSPIPINYFKACNILENSSQFRKHFKCTIHKSEITSILKQPFLFYSLIMDDLIIYKNKVSVLHENMLTLLAHNMNSDWIKLPSINLFKSRLIL
jgi:hypothetical protein